MNGYKTSGDWTDITSIGRNEVVFEGRHKAYGAFYIRQRYPNALLLALLSAIAFIGSCAIIAYALRSVRYLGSELETSVVAKPDVFTMPPATHASVPPHPTVKPSVQAPKTTPNNLAPPVIINHEIDTATTKYKEEPIITASPTNPGSGVGVPNSNPRVSEGAAMAPPDNKPLMWVSEMPKFPDGSINDYLAKQINYPPGASQTGIQGIVYASFVIERDGSVSNVTLVRGISDGADLNKEALRVLSEMPRWIPGKQDGHPVQVEFMVPIHFKLQ